MTFHMQHLITVIMNTTTTIHSNAIPVYVDINPETFNMDVNKLECKITEKTKGRKDLLSFDRSGTRAMCRALV